MQGMKFARIALHGVVLTSINIVSIVAGFLAYQYLFRHQHPIQIQVPVALAVTSLGFLFWKMLVRVSGKVSIMMNGFPEYFAVYCVAFIWTPVLFIPAHRVFAGYVTAPGNILAIWMFQMWANALALAVVGWVARWVKFAVEIPS